MRKLGLTGEEVMEQLVSFMMDHPSGFMKRQDEMVFGEWLIMFKDV